MHKVWNRLAALIFVVCATPSWAHEGPEDMIAILTERIEVAPTPSNLTQRAGEWMVLSHFQEARNDLQQAIELDANFWTARLALAKVHRDTGELDAGLEIIDEALRRFDSQHARRSFFQLQAELYEANNELRESLQAIQSAIQLGSTEMDDFLRRSRLQADLGLGKQRIEDLKRAMDNNRGIVLKNEYIDSLIDVRQFGKALPLIERRLRESRRKSAWLIRRARVYQGQELEERALVDLETAEIEIQGLLNPKRPHPGLLLELKQVYEMTNRLEDAKAVSAQLMELDSGV